MTAKWPFVRGNSIGATLANAESFMGKSDTPVPVNDRTQQVLLALLTAFAIYAMTQLLKDHDTLTQHAVALDQLQRAQSEVITELKEIRLLLAERSQ